MESQPQNPEYRNNPENSLMCVIEKDTLSQCLVPDHPRKMSELDRKFVYLDVKHQLTLPTCVIC